MKSAAQYPEVKGGFVLRDGEDFYRIENFDQLTPFLMTVVSSTDHWMYVSSSGGLTMGRVSADNCFFPYQTVDNLHDSYRHTGPMTYLRYTNEAGESEYWQPFNNGIAQGPVGVRNLYKHLLGNQVVFEELNDTVGLAFQYSWRASDEYGFVRTGSVENKGNTEIEIEVVDGFQNVCPSGVPLSTYQSASCLIDAYKHNECDSSTGMGIYSLTSKIVDRAEALEALRASIVWHTGLTDSLIFLSKNQLDHFLKGNVPSSETNAHGKRGNYFVYSKFTLAPGETRTWYLAADVSRDHCQIAQVRKQLLDNQQMDSALETSMRENHQSLLRNVASSDGLQSGGSKVATAHHLANVLFNNMRGGVPAENYVVESADFAEFISKRNHSVAAAEHTFLQQLPENIDYPELLTQAEVRGNADLTRLTMEYLPLTFGRRHGDPSRPWNAFEILSKNDDGSRIYSYQGNWRDIFQNWEALCMSFPALLPSVVAKFVNAMTIDGYNPYRITNEGIDWEVPDPEDPWSNIGYWGDHQIVYLTKLLESLQCFSPSTLSQLLEKQIFCYANIPYRIKPFEEIAENASETIDYDIFTAKEIARRVEELGADGKLISDSKGSIYRANLVEKLLVPVLAKLSNFVVDGGIWLNTQRPEWNDANNAIVGAGLSMVTVCQLRRHLGLLIELLQEKGERRISISVEVEQWFRNIRQILLDHRSALREEHVSDEARRQIIESAGRAFSDYRLKVYEDGFSGKHTIASGELIEFFRLATEYIDHSIHANRSDLLLYHSYNLLDLQESDTDAIVRHLYEMLEGQVAAISSGVLDTGEVLELIDTMFSSKLYRQDQRSFMLYPDRTLPGFLERNAINSDRVQEVELFRKLVEADDRSVITQDSFGNYHFHFSIEKRKNLEESLDRLALDDRWSSLVASNRDQVLDIFEEVFSHKTYTGRSGTMYGYEGLGSIYWHMVSKLLLSVQENVFRAFDQHSSKTMIEALADSYYLVRGGLSSDKTPVEYGAFPTDPYSHTPKHSGAQQPGMTGQVKEEVLTRWGELGIRVKDGRLSFQPIILRRREFLNDESEFSYIDLSGAEQKIALPQNSLAFTVFQVPVVYTLVDSEMSITITDQQGQDEQLPSGRLDPERSMELFNRDGTITRIDVSIPESQILRA